MNIFFKMNFFIFYVQNLVFIYFDLKPAGYRHNKDDHVTVILKIG